MPERLTVAETLLAHGITEHDIDALAFAPVVPACCEDGCHVEPDGTCPHGHPSILIDMGIV